MQADIRYTVITKGFLKVYERCFEAVPGGTPKKV